MAAYGTDQDFQAWLAAQGLTLPSGSPAPEILRQIGSSYVDSAYEWRLSCSSRTGGFSQELAWPRTGHTVNCEPVPDDYIPTAWVNASYRAAYLQATQNGWATNYSQPDRLVKRQKLEGLEREFFAPSESQISSDAAVGMPSDALINGMISMWLCPTGRSANSLFMVI